MRTQQTLHGDGYVAVVIDHGFCAAAVRVQYAIPRPEVETILFRRGYDLRGTEWEFCPDDRTPLDYLPDADELPIGRVVHGEGYRASLRYTPEGVEARYIDCSIEPGKAIHDLSAKGVKVTTDCVVWKLPTPNPCTDPKKATAAHRRRFYTCVAKHQNVFLMAGLTIKILKQYYYRQFGVKSMSELDPKQYAIAAAEVACMADDVSILHARAAKMRVSIPF